MSQNAKSKTRSPGTERAAQFLMVLGEDSAADVLRQLNENEVQKIGAVMTTMSELSSDLVNEVLETFIEEASNDASIKVVADEYTKAVLVQALGEDGAQAILDKILMGGNTKGLDALRWMDPAMVAGIIQGEHPQIQATIVSYLDSEHAAEVLEFLPEKVVLEIIIRVAGMESVDPKALSELNQALEGQVEGVVTKQSSAMGGVKIAADIMNILRGADDELMDKIVDVDAEMARRIQDRMFVFEDLKDMPDRDFQALIRELPTDKLAISMKAADDTLTEKLFSNMSTRAADIFREDLENLGPVRVSDVEMAQKEILAVAKRMSESGEINLSEDDGQMIG